MRWSGGFSLLILNISGIALTHHFFGAPWSGLLALAMGTITVCINEVCAAIVSLGAERAS